MKKRTALFITVSMIAFFMSVALYITACDTSNNNGNPAEGVLTHKEITVDRGTFTYREGGSKTGQPVVMIHGWPENSYCWDGVAAELDSSLRVIAPDLRGLGDSERTLDESKYQKAELAKDIVEIVDALGITDFYLVGHDWGGVVAQEVAIAVPDRVKKLVIMNIPIIINLQNNLAARDIIYDQGGKPFWYQYFQQQAKLPEEMIPGNEEVWVSHFFGDRPVPQASIDEYVRCYSIDDTPTTAASLYRVMDDDGMRWYELAVAETTFPMPGLYIYGNLDSVIIPEYLVGIENYFPAGIQVVEVESAHFLQEEKPAEVAQAMNAFFTAQ